jgi:hypothetical protein
MSIPAHRSVVCDSVDAVRDEPSRTLHDLGPDRPLRADDTHLQTNPNRLKLYSAATSAAWLRAITRSIIRLTGARASSRVFAARIVRKSANIESADIRMAARSTCSSLVGRAARISLAASPCSVCEPDAMPCPASVPVPAAISSVPALIFEYLSRTCAQDTMANPCTRSRDDKIVAGKPANRPSDQGRRSEKNTGARERF